MQSGLNLPEDRGGNHLIPRRNLRGQGGKEFQGALNAHLCGRGNIDAAHGHAERFRFQPLPFAVGAGLLAHIFLVGFLHVIGRGFLIPALHGRDDAFKCGLIHFGTIRGVIGDRDGFRPRAVENGMHRFLGEILHRGIHGKPILLPERFHERAGHAVAVRIGKAHGMERPLMQGERLVRKNGVRGNLHQIAQAGAVRTGAEGTVEGKHAGTEFLNGNAAVGTGVVHGEGLLAFVEQVHDHQTA